MAVFEVSVQYGLLSGRPKRAGTSEGQPAGRRRKPLPAELIKTAAELSFVLERPLHWTCISAHRVQGRHSHRLGAWPRSIFGRAPGGLPSSDSELVIPQRPLPLR